MIQNDNIALEYGDQRSFTRTLSLPSAYKPVPTIDDYSNGYFTRTFVLKRNDPLAGREIDPRKVSQVDQNMYQLFTFKWKISGRSDRYIVNGIIEDEGVENANKYTIRTLDPRLQRFFPNPLEYWRGY